MLVVDDVTKRFGKLLALDAVSFSVEPGSVVGFLGPNGAGKTTTMRAIMGLLTVDAGSVTWRGSRIDDAARQRFGYMPAERGMYQRMKVRDHLVYYGRLSGLTAAAAGAAADTWLERLGLTGRGGDTVQSLSSGNQQRVQLALALLNEPELLVLDEPFSGLDPIAVEMLTEVLREQVANGVALLLSSHQLDLVADVCSAVVIVDRGRVVLQGDVQQLRAGSEQRIVEVEFASAVEAVWPHAVVSDGGQTASPHRRRFDRRSGAVRPGPRPRHAHRLLVRPAGSVRRVPARRGPHDARTRRPTGRTRRPTCRSTGRAVDRSHRRRRMKRDVIQLVAAREISQRLRAKSFYIGTGLLIAIILAVGLISRFAGGDDTPADIAVCGGCRPGRPHGDRRRRRVHRARHRSRRRPRRHGRVLRRPRHAAQTGAGGRRRRRGAGP
jgi:ABC-2 type transport system ATP-binding protein